ncbi:hypothetical protein ACRB68_78300 [Actinomadura sp. RB68]|uniref:HTH luxR-type domain-containing protein n=2 Tax=Actinomadura macrotermitis TaxID=2585200 RepID=A0A7K0C891_9ACTN|nr:hypothetical protein [Actinomadura macrotermitis]
MERIEPLFKECTEGLGATVIISGGVGMGKTALLEAVAERAAQRGHTILGAVGSRAESEFPYTVLEQLFHSVEHTENGAGLLDLLERATMSRPDVSPAQIMQAAYRTLREIGDLAPVTISIDDTQYADPESLRCLLHLIRRCRRAPVTVFLACGSTDPGESQTLLAELACRPGIRHLSLTALSREGVARLVVDRFGVGSADQRSREFYAVSGGNPLLVQALLHDHSVQAALDGDLRPAPGDVFRDASLACVHRSGRDSLRVARGIAVLNGAGSTALLGQLVGLGERDVRSALKVLSDARLLDGTRFRHPTIRGGVLDEIPAEDRTRLHGKAASLLWEEGAATTAVASHLLACGTVRDDWAVRLLVAAADEALAADQVEQATRFLGLAGTSCTDDKQRHLISMGLAQIMRRVRPEASTRILQDLAGPAKEGNVPGVVRIKVAHGLLMRGQVDEAVEILKLLGEERTTDRQFAAEMDIARLWLASTYPGVADRLAGALGRPPGQQPAAARHTAVLRVGANRALWLTLTKGADECVVADAERVLQSLPIGDRTIDSIVSAVMTLVYADRLKTAASWCDQVLTRAADREVPMWTAQLLTSRALIALRQGGLGRATELAETALDLMPEEAWGVGIGMPLAVLVEARTAMGDYKASADLVNRPVPESLFLTRFGLHYLYARGRYHLANGDHDVALADFLACGEKARAWGLDSPVLAPWRVGAAEALLVRGQRERAGEIADEHLALASTGQRRTHGIALRAAAATRPPSQQLEQLSKSLEMLQPTGDRYETALTLADLGRTYQRHGRAGRARLIIRQAWYMAKECGAEELQTTLMPKPAGGEEPEPAGETAAPHGVTRLLSEAEMRVTALAAQGFTNREISNKLFITVSTVEQHLTRVYRKLNIRHRQELPANFA